MASKPVLAIDNSIDFLNLALAADGQLLEERHMRPERPSSEVLPLRVAELLESRGCALNDLSLLVVTLGPGSFTGIRVGLSFCKGLAAGRGIPLVGVPTLDVLAAPFAHMEGHFLCPLLDAKKGEVFTSLYHVEAGTIRRIIPFQAVRPAGIGALIRTPCICFGTGTKLCEGILSSIPGVMTVEDAFERISGEHLLSLGLARYAAGTTEELKPIYCRRSEAEIKFNIIIR